MTYRDLLTEMKIPKDILKDLKKAIGKDTLSPETLYKNIKGSTGTDKKLAEIFAVDIDLVQRIKKMDEAKGPKSYIGKSDGMNVAVFIDGFDNQSLKGGNFGDMVRLNKILKTWKTDAKKTRFDAKGKATLASAKKWVKENNPSEFYARWKPDSSSYKDDSVEILYKD